MRVGTRRWAYYDELMQLCRGTRWREKLPSVAERLDCLEVRGTHLCGRDWR